MKISVFGTGYVGLVTGVCFAEMGNDVICVDVDPKKVETLRGGKSPIYEPGLDEMLEANISAERIQFTTDAQTAIKNSDIIFIAVGTPPQEDGSADLTNVFKVADTISSHMEGYKLIVTKSTVPVGTNQKIKERIQAGLINKTNASFDICSNPEFLREGSALEDCLQPSRVVVGSTSEKAEKLMRRLYEPFLKDNTPLLFMDLASAELTKYAANSMLAAKISIMNEFSRLCEKVGANIEQVRRGIGSDPRIGPHFIYAGIGYGGSCFPKDVKALIHIGDQEQEAMPILNAVEEVNQTQRLRFAEKSEKIMGGLKGKKVALWGVAFKPGTDDIREAPSLYVIEQCLKMGAKIIAYDPVAEQNAREFFAQHPERHLFTGSLEFSQDQYDALEGATALVIVTEWKSFREPDFVRMKTAMKSPIVFDGRNIYGTDVMKEQGFQYLSIGRGQL
jgi:UDPglucose 6-dehydrogenase